MFFFSLGKCCVIAAASVFFFFINCVTSFYWYRQRLIKWIYIQLIPLQLWYEWFNVITLSAWKNAKLNGLKLNGTHATYTLACNAWPRLITPVFFFFRKYHTTKNTHSHTNDIIQIYSICTTFPVISEVTAMEGKWNSKSCWGKKIVMILFVCVCLCVFFLTLNNPWL